jgi:hypothetical protein
LGADAYKRRHTVGGYTIDIPRKAVEQGPVIEPLRSAISRLAKMAADFPIGVLGSVFDDFIELS